MAYSVLIVHRREPPPSPQPGLLSASSSAKFPVGLAGFGFLATLVVVLGGVLAGAAGPAQGNELWGIPAIPVEPRINLAVALSLFYGGMILLVRSWVQLRRHVLTSSSQRGSDDLKAPQSAKALLRTIVIVVAIWALPLLVGPPLGSRDVYAYAAQGRMAEVGIDVYQQGPRALGVDPVLDAIDPIYLDAPVVYGPVFVTMSEAVMVLTKGPVGSVLLFRLLALCGLSAAGFGVWDLARGLGRDPVDALVLSIANPLVLLHLVSGAHNEAIMLGFLIGGVAVGRRVKWRWLGIVLCALGATIKVPAILGVAFLAWPWAMTTKSSAVRLWRLLASVLVAGAVVGVAGFLTGWGWGWLEAAKNAQPVDAYLSVTRVLGGGLQLLTGGDIASILQIVRPAGLIVAGLATAFLIIGGRQNMPVALGWSLLLFAIMHPTTQPWYLTWGLLLVAAGSAGARNRAFMVLSGFAAFVVLPIGPQLGLALLESTGAGLIALTMAALVLLTLSPAAAEVRGPLRKLDADLISVIVPTRNEAPNIAPMVRRLSDAIENCEVLFVDDSDDDTPQVIQDLVQKSTKPGWHGPSVRLIHRTNAGRWGGLGGAVVDGLMQADGAIAVVIDGDLQHPPEEIPTLVTEVRGGADLVVASRRIAGGSGGAGLTVTRDWMSRQAGGVSRMLFPQRVGRIADPLSGFFAVRLDRIEQHRLHPDGFKILIEILATHPELTTTEVPFQFADRAEGQSKASLGQGTRFLSHLLDLRLRTSRPWGGSIGTQRVFRSG